MSPTTEGTTLNKRAKPQQASSVMLRLAVVRTELLLAKHPRRMQHMPKAINKRRMPKVALPRNFSQDLLQRSASPRTTATSDGGTNVAASAAKTLLDLVRQRPRRAPPPSVHKVRERAPSGAEVVESASRPERRRRVGHV
jgi:hypothetical protein